jgi:O-antigen/teichoic acid export membrane protein
MKKPEKREFDSSLRLLAKSSVIVFIGIAISKISTYVYRIIVARHFGPEVYGLLALALMVVGWFGAFSSLGLSPGLVRFISLYRGKKQNNKIKHIIRFSIAALTITGIFSAIVVFILADTIAISIFKNPSLSPFLQIFSIIIPLSLFSNILTSIIQGYEKIAWFSFINNIFANILRIGALVALIFLGLNTNSIPLSYLIMTFGVLAISYYVVRYKIKGVFGKYKLRNKKTINKALLSYSWPVLFSGIIASIFFWIDTFFIGFYNGATSVGHYNAATPIALLLTFAPQLFLQLFLPLITREYGKNRHKVIKELSKQVNKWISIINMPVFFMMILFPGAIINILFGPEYLVAESSLRILAVGLFIYSFSNISNNLISMAGKSKVILFSLLITSLIDVVLNIILVPKYGISGAAFSTSISYIVLAGAYIYKANSFVSVIPLRRKMLKIFFISMIPAALLLVARNFIAINLLTFIILGVFFLLVYILLILITKSLDDEDIMILRLLKNKILSPLNGK